MATTHEDAIAEFNHVEGKLERGEECYCAICCKWLGPHAELRPPRRTCITCGGQGTVSDGGYVACPACGHATHGVMSPGYGE